MPNSCCCLPTSTTVAYATCIHLAPPPLPPSPLPLRCPTCCLPTGLHFHTSSEQCPLPTSTECSAVVCQLHCWSNRYSLRSSHLKCRTATVCVQVLSWHWTHWPQHGRCWATQQAQCSAVWSQSHHGPNQSSWIQILHGQYDSCVQHIWNQFQHHWLQCCSKWQ